MPPPRPYCLALFLMRLREVGYPPHQVALAFWKDWRGFCLCSHLIPSVTERSALFVKELSFPQTALTFWKDWRGSCLCSELIPSVTERSTLFIKELSFPQTASTDDAFFNRNWVGARRDRWAGI